MNVHCQGGEKSTALTLGCFSLELMPLGGMIFFVINFNCISLHIVITIIPIVILVAKAFDPIDIANLRKAKFWGYHKEGIVGSNVPLAFVIDP